ncbi:ADP-ribosylation/Crystallin J1 [Cladorrhinum samala]|uniref:ADP-ribosylhydrolase ARH3 n=1 Tax=Cladorrhinum samala TaxID=585594 RepID=A0AAV9HX96_9PEZI|nr:ADP-ribosylation/Crystallin J1 [Cladorrhinum samala]
MVVTKESRIKGALLGVHAGDSLGATVEFNPWKTIQAKYPNGLRDIVGGGSFRWAPGAATDDTDLTRAVLLAYYDSAKHKKQGSDPQDSGSKGSDSLVQTAAKYMLDWYEGNNWPGRAKGRRPNDVGGATATALSAFGKSRDPTKSGCGEGNAGNGSLMRCIATGLFQSDPQKLVEESEAISKVTHGDSECVISCAVYNVMVRELVGGKTPNEAWDAGMDLVNKMKEKENRNRNGYRYKAAAHIEKVLNGAKVVSLHDLASNGPLKSANWKTELPFDASGYVLESLKLAVAAMLDERSLEDVLVDVVRVGRDTDTNGAIAGGLLGARDGVEAIPPRWLEQLQFRNEFEEIVDYILGSAA